MPSTPISEHVTPSSHVYVVENHWVLEKWEVHTIAGIIEASVVRHTSDSMSEMHMLNGSNATGGVRAVLLTTESVLLSD